MCDEENIYYSALHLDGIYAQYLVCGVQRDGCFGASMIFNGICVHIIIPTHTHTADAHRSHMNIYIIHICVGIDLCV